MKKSCRECSELLIGRSDKIFCSDHCRTTYYNKLNSDATRFVRNINNILRKNRRILCNANPGGKTKIHKNTLLQRGFNFNYHTNTYVTKAGKQYTFCYEQGYLSIGNDYFALVIRQEYID